MRGARYKVQPPRREGGGQTLALLPKGPAGKPAYHSREIADRVSPIKGVSNAPYSLTVRGHRPPHHGCMGRQTLGYVARNHVIDREASA